MKLLRLTLDNFRATKHLDFVPEGNNATIYGRNSTGKTTIYNAFTWLLFGKSATGEKNFSPKTLDNSGQEKHHLQHKVEGVFLMEDEKRLTLTRILSENHTKKRGTGDVIFEGNTTEYYIDGVPTKAKEYDATVKAICDEEKVKILTMPDYFPAVLPWQKRREMMLEVVGETLSDDDIIGSQKELQPLQELLQQYGTRYTIDQLLKVAKEEKRKLAKDLEDIPVRIDEATKAIQAVDYNREDLERQVKVIQQKIAELEEKKQQVSAPSITAENRRCLAELQAELAEERTKFAAEHMNNYEEAYAKQRDEISGYEIDLRRLQREYSNLDSEEHRLNADRERTAKEYAQVQSRQWTGDTICPTCGRELPEEKIEEAKRKFNLDKSKKLEQLNQYGKEHCSKEMIAEVQVKKEAKGLELAQMKEKISAGQKELAAIKGLSQKTPKFEESAIYAEMKQKIAALEELVKSGNTEVAGQLEDLNQKVVEEKQRLSLLQKQQFVLDANEQHKKRIAELEEQEQAISANLEQAEYKISLCDKFVNTKIELLTQQFNSHFDHVRFKLFDQQINGGYTECCEVMIPCEQGGEQMLVPYNIANTGSKMFAGLEIINTLSKYWNISLPVFIDNAESYTSLPDIDSQVIQLVVSAVDPVLRIEVAGSNQPEYSAEPTPVAGDCIGIEF